MTTAIDEKIEALKKQIAEIEEEKVRLELMPKNQRLAEAIHGKQCRWNHTDGCGWYYESWEKGGHSRNSYLEKANKMLAEMSFEQAMTVIKFM